MSVFRIGWPSCTYDGPPEGFRCAGLSARSGFSPRPVSWAGATGAPTTKAQRPVASPTPLTQLDLRGLSIAREPFCEKLETLKVQAALGGRVTATDHYGNGDTVEFVPGVRDVSHEFGCTFSGAPGAQARAWVFAEPVRRGRPGSWWRRPSAFGPAGPPDR